MGYEFQAKRTNYGGTWFKSNLEARTAEALDDLGVHWEYESRCFRDRRYAGGQYTPDFYLPASNTYVEVVGRIDERHLRNARVFCETQRVPQDEWDYPIYDEAHPCLAFVTGNGYMAMVDERGGASDDVYVSVCRRCGRLFFIKGWGLWGCPHCGGDTGKHVHHGNLFEYAASRRAERD